MSQFDSEVKTTSVRVHLLCTGPLDSPAVPACPVSLLPAHLCPKLVLADPVLVQALSAQPGFHRSHPAGSWVG